MPSPVLPGLAIPLGGTPLGVVAATSGVAVTAGITIGYNTPGKVSIPVPSYKTLVVELWGGGNSNAQSGGGDTSIAKLNLLAQGAQNSNNGGYGTGSGGDVNKPGMGASAAGFSGTAYNGGSVLTTTPAGTGIGNAPGGGGAPTNSSYVGGDGGGYCKKTYTYGAAGAPQPGSLLQGIVGAADIQTGVYQGSLVYNSGGPGRIALTVLS